MPELYEFVKLHNTGAKLIMPVIICSLHFIAKTTTYILNIKFASFKTKIVQLRSKITTLSANMSNRSFKSCLVLEKNLLLVPGIFLEVTKTSIFGAWYIREPVRPNFQFFFVQTFFRLFHFVTMRCCWVSTFACTWAVFLNWGSSTEYGAPQLK